MSENETTTADGLPGDPDEPPLVHADGVTAGYLPGVDILFECSLELYEGELVTIVGPNGAGKSTLLKSLFGLVDVRGGRVTLRGDHQPRTSSWNVVSATSSRPRTSSPR